MPLINIISIMIMFGLPYRFLYNRKKKWNTESLKKTLTIALIPISVIGVSFANTSEFKMFFYSFITTPIYLFIDSYFKKLSKKKHKRDFYLWLNFSDERYKNNKFENTDIVFSIMLLILIALLSVLGVSLFGKDNLYEKLI